MDAGFRVGAPPLPPSPLQQAVDREEETFELESAEETERAEGPSATPESASTTVPPPPLPPTPPRDENLAVKTISFGGQVSGLSLPTMTQATAEQAKTFFGSHQNDVPTAISLSGNNAVFTYGDKSLKVDLGTLKGMLEKGQVKGNSKAIQSLIVAQTINSLKLSPSITGDITRSFIKDLKAGTSPQMARVNAYAASVAAIALGPDPKGQLQKDMKAVDDFCKQMPNKTAAKDVQAKLFEVMAKQMNAIANNDWAAARDHQENLRILAGQVGLKGIGAPPMADLELPENPVEKAAAQSSRPKTIENEVVDKFVRGFAEMAKGDSTEVTTDGEGGVKLGLGVAFKVPVVGKEGPTLAKAAVELTGRVGGKSTSTVERDEEGNFIVTERRFIGGGLKGGFTGQALVELAGGDGSGDVGHLKLTKLKFGSAEDVGRYMASQSVGDIMDIDDAPIKQVGAAPTAKPLPGRFVVVEESSGLATRTETQLRHVGLTKGSEKSSALGGGFFNAVRRFLPNFPNRTTSTDTTRYKTTTGTSVVERNYASKSESGNLLLKILSLGFAGRVTTRSNVSVKLRQVSPPPVGAGQDKMDLPSTFKPSVGIQVDSGKVQACKDEAAVDILVKKEFDRLVALQKAANKDAGKPVFDLSADGMEYTKQAVRNCFMLVYNEHHYTPKPEERPLQKDKDLIATDINVVIAGNGGGIGWTSGGMVTFKIPFAEQKDAPGTFRANSGGVEVGMTTVSGKRFNASIGIDTEDIPGSPVKFTAGAYVKGSETDTDYQQVIGRGVIQPSAKKA